MIFAQLLGEIVLATNLDVGLTIIDEEQMGRATRFLARELGDIDLGKRNPQTLICATGFNVDMRYFVVEDGTDVSTYASIELAVRAIEPPDIPRTKLFDELGNQYPLSIEKKKILFFWIWPTIVPSTANTAPPCAMTFELESCLRNYASKVGIRVPLSTELPELVDLIATSQGF